MNEHHTLGKQKQKISIETSEGLFVVFICDLSHIEAYGNYTKVYIKQHNRFLLTRKTLGNFEAHLSGFGFVRVHYGFLVNVMFIQSLNIKTSFSIHLQNGHVVPLAHRRKRLVVEFVSKFLDAL